jgi:hypothetical protein
MRGVRGEVLGYPVEIEPGYKVDTRLVEPIAAGYCFPDLKLSFSFRSSNGVPSGVAEGGLVDRGEIDEKMLTTFAGLSDNVHMHRTAEELRDCVFLSEHKWDSRIRPDQLVCYAGVLQSLPTYEKRLITIVARPDQKIEAETTLVSVPTTHLYWEDVYEILAHAHSPDPLLAEFVDFMKAKNLNPGAPIDAATMRWFLASISFKRQLIRYSDKLLNEYDWSIIPEPYRAKRKVNDKWGRVALDFKGAEWFPTIALGFLYDPTDHRVTLTAPVESIDLFMRIEAEPDTSEDCEKVLSTLRQKAEQLRLLGPRVLLRDDPGNGNSFSLLMVQESLQSAVGKFSEERAQIEAIYYKLHGWASCLFEDKRIEELLNNLKSSGLPVDPPEPDLVSESKGNVQ